MLKYENDEKLSKYKVVKSMLLAIVMTLWSFRVLYNNPIVTYVPIMMFVLMQLLENIRNKSTLSFKLHEVNRYFIVFVFILYAFILLIGNNGSFIEFGKFILFCLLGMMVSCTSITEIRRSIKYTLFITTPYSIYIYLFYDSVIARSTGLNGALNYLNVTWSSAVGLTILLTVLLFKEYNKKNYILLGLLVFVHLIALLRYTAAGNILFPWLSVIFLYSLKNVKHVQKYFKIVIVGVVAIIGYIVLKDYLQDNAVISKISSIFETLNSGEENNRIILWSQYIEEIIQKDYYILGIGIQNSETVMGNYPHNFMLEIIGETGIIGSILFLSYLIFQLKEYFVCYWYQKNDLLFMIISSLLLYYFLTYSKSFSIFSASQFFVVIGMFNAYRSELSVSLENQKKTKGGSTEKRFM